MAITKPLANFEEDLSERVYDYLKPLIRIAENYIPVERHADTVLYVLATAGMRMVPEAKQRAIITEVNTVDTPKL